MVHRLRGRAPAGRIGSLGHVVARFNGGANTPDNLAWSCLWCNTRPNERQPGATDRGAVQLALTGRPLAYVVPLDAGQDMLAWRLVAVLSFDVSKHVVRQVLGVVRRHDVLHLGQRSESSAMQPV